MKKIIIFLLAIVIPLISIARYQNIGTAWKDRHISYLAQYALDNDSDLYDKQAQINLSVATCNRIVLLLGQVPSDELKQHAKDIVNQIPQVRYIYNRITIAPPISAATRSNDTWITAKAKSSLLFTKGVESTKIKIVTEDGIVYLMGSISRQQSEVVINVITQLPGVKKIVKIFEYTD